MNTISVYNSLWIKVRQTLFGLFISSHTVMNSSETSVTRGYVNEFIQNFSILLKLLKFVFVFVEVGIITIIGFAAQTQHFRTMKLLFEKTRFSFIMFYMFCEAGFRKEIVCCISCEIIFAIFCSQ